MQRWGTVPCISSLGMLNEFRFFVVERIERQEYAHTHESLGKPKTGQDISSMNRIIEMSICKEGRHMVNESCNMLKIGSGLVIDFRKYLKVFNRKSYAYRFQDASL